MLRGFAQNFGQSLTLLKIALILYEAPLIAFAWVVLFDSFVLACGFIYFFLKTNNKYTNRPVSISNLKLKKEAAVLILKDLWSLILSGIAIMIYVKIDQTMIKGMLDSEAVEQYAAAVRISEARYFIPMVITSSFFPAIINAKNRAKSSTMLDFKGFMI